MINRAFVEKLYDKLYELQGEISRRLTKAGMDMIGFEGDIAMQHSLIMGPDTWRSVDKPRLAKIIASCKKINNDVHIGTPEDCRKEAITYIERCGQSGGLVLGASNSIGYDVPVENIVAWYEAVRDYKF